MQRKYRGDKKYISLIINKLKNRRTTDVRLCRLSPTHKANTRRHSVHPTVSGNRTETQIQSKVRQMTGKRQVKTVA